MKKTWKVIAAAGIMSLLAASAVFAGTWKNDGVGDWYENDDGSYLTSGIHEVDGARYLFGDNGYIQRGWVKDQHFATWRYFDPFTGAQQMGWVLINGKYYYLDPANGGAMKTGWFEENGIKYYLDQSDGHMMANETFFVMNDDGVEYGYRADQNGALIKGTTVEDKEQDKTFRYLDDGVITYKTGSSKRAGFNDEGWRYYKKGDEQTEQKASDDEFTQFKADELKDSYYTKYRKSMQTSNVSRRQQKRKEWEANVKKQLKGYMTDSEISSYISSVESGFYTPTTDVDDFDDEDYDDEDYDYDWED